MSTSVLFKRHFQIAYVSDDAKAAIASFSRDYGVTEWKLMDMPAIHGPESAIRWICLAWIGDVMVEIIEPNYAVDSIYSDWDRKALNPLRLHHLGFLVESEADLIAAKRQLGALGHAVATEGSFGDTLDFAYIDTTASLGHFYEIIHLRDKAFFDDVPVN